MSTEDKEWSLKKKENFIPDAGAHNREYFDKNCYYYNKKDIETLREKLIEDIRDIQKEDSDFVGYDDGTIECDIVIKIINRRFGYED